MTTTRLRLVACSSSLTFTACALFVGIGDHHLEETPTEAATGDATDVDGSSTADTSSSGDGSRDDGSNTGLPTFIVATGQANPTAIVLDFNFLFWINQGSAASPPSIMRLEKASDAGPVALAPGRSHPISLRLAPGSIVFTESGDGGTNGLFRVTRDGNSPVALWDFDDAGRSFGALFVKDSPPLAFSEAIDPDGGNASIRRGTLPSFAPDFSATCFVYTSPTATRFPSISVDDSYVYFADTSAKAILRTTKDCGVGAVETFAKDEDVRVLVGDLQNVYWATVDGAVRHLAKATPLSPPTTHATDLVSPTGIAIRAGNIYVADEGDGKVWWFTVGLQKILVADHQAGPTGIIMAQSPPDEGTLYWTNRLAGEIVKAVP